MSKDQTPEPHQSRKARESKPSRSPRAPRIQSDPNIHELTSGRDVHDQMGHAEGTTAGDFEIKRGLHDVQRELRDLASNYNTRVTATDEFVSHIQKISQGLNETAHVIKGLILDHKQMVDLRQTTPDETELTKTKLENEELFLRIKELSNWKQKWAQYAISFFVPIATASIALLAAYVELRSVRSERDKLAVDKEQFEKLKANDYTNTKISNATEMLDGSSGDKTTSDAAILRALQDIMLSGKSIPDRSLEVIFPLILVNNQYIANTARTILDRSNSKIFPSTLRTALLVQGSKDRVKLIEIMRTSSFDKYITEFVPLIDDRDALLSGAAIRVVASGFKNGALNEIMPANSGLGTYHDNNYFVTSVLLKDKDAKLKSLKNLADSLIGSAVISMDSIEFSSACLLSRAGNFFDSSILSRNDISPANKILIGLTLPAEKRAGLSSLIEAAFSDIKSTAALLQLGIDLDMVSTSFKVDPPHFSLSDAERYSTDDVSRTLRFIDVNAASHNDLVKLRNLLKTGGSFDWRKIDDKIVELNGYDLAASLRDDINKDEFMEIASRAQDSEAIDKVTKMLEEELADKNSSIRFGSSVRIAMNLVKAGKSTDILNKVAERDEFNLLANINELVSVDRAFAVEYLKKKYNAKDLTARQVAALAAKAQIVDEFSDLVQKAFDEQLESISGLSQENLDARSDRGEIFTAMEFLSFLTQSPEFKRDSDRLASKIEALGEGPETNGYEMIEIGSGSIGFRVGAGAISRLAKLLAPELLEISESANCGHPGKEGFLGSDQVRNLLLDAIVVGAHSNSPSLNR
jgi:hypothetical protein